MNARAKGRRGQQMAADVLRSRDDFYVYLHKRKTDGSVFYVGKGRGNRAWVHQSRRTDSWNEVNRLHGHVVQIVIYGLQEWAACEMETELIAYYGMENLVNKQTGGISGYKFDEELKERLSQIHSARERSPLSEETKRKIGDANRGLVRSPEFVEMLRLRATGKKASLETRQKQSASTKGRKMSQAAVEATTAAKRKAVVCATNGMWFESQKHAADWVRNCLGIPSANNKRINSVVKGIAKTAYGLEWRYADGVIPKGQRTERANRGCEHVAVA